MPILDAEFKAKLMSKVKNTTRKQLIAAILVVAILITIITCSVVLSDKTRRANVNRIELGDSYSQVIKKLGKPDEELTGSYYWFRGVADSDEALEYDFSNKPYTMIVAKFAGEEGAKKLYSISYQIANEESEIKSQSLSDFHSEYALGEDIDYSDMSVEVYYDNGSFIKSTVRRVWSPIDTNTLGEQTLVVSLDMFTKYEFDVVVKDPKDITGDGDTVLITYLDGADTIYKTIKKRTKLKNSLYKRGHTPTIYDSKHREVNLDKKVKKNTTYTVEWTPNKYKVSFVLPEGYSQTFDTQEVTFGEDYELPIVTENTGFFEGWSNIENDTSALTYNDGKSKSPWDFVNDTVMYAIMGDSCTVTLTSSLSGATLEGAGVYSYADTKQVTVKAKSSSYLFGGWYDGEECVSNDREYTFDITKKHVSLKAVFGASKFTIENRDDGSVVLTDYNAAERDTSVVIPAGVTSIGSEAFRYCRGLTSITIPSSVTSIGEGAFMDCSSLTSITIPNSVTSIGDHAFNGCSSLTSITIPDSVTSIGYGAFMYCSSLTSITIPFVGEKQDGTGNTDFGHILGGSSPKTVVVTGGSSIGSYAFSYYGSLTSITIPDSVTYIGEGAFSGCSSLTSITIPEDVTSIGYGAFMNCSSLTSITMPEGVTSIGGCAFYGCSSLTSITIPSSVASIGDYAFSGCSSLTSITIPDSVTSIGREAFYNCSSLTSITFEDTSTWYRTIIYSNWSNKTGGTATTVTNTSTNATYFKSTYVDYYWYKL